MERVTLCVYTREEMLQRAVPFCVDGVVHQAVPHGPGVYVLLWRRKVMYVGKSINDIHPRLGTYRHDAHFTHVFWHITPPEWAETYEQIYIMRLKPLMNGRYHRFSPLSVAVSEDVRAEIDEAIRGLRIGCSLQQPLDDLSIPLEGTLDG